MKQPSVWIVEMTSKALWPKWVTSVDAGCPKNKREWALRKAKELRKNYRGVLRYRVSEYRRVAK